MNNLKKILKNRLNNSSLNVLIKYRNLMVNLFFKTMYPYGKFIKTPVNLLINQKKCNRKLEIGPGAERIPGFETINIVWGHNVDYVGDATKKLPFKSETFEVLYASHVLEHIPWYNLKLVLKEWVRIIKSGGNIEVWVPNGLLIAKTFLDAEHNIENNIHLDGWYKFNEQKDPCVWANGRFFSYGDGTGKKNDPNWHLAIFSPRYLKILLEQSGLTKVECLDRTEVRGYDHGWINLGFRGLKP